MKYLLTNIEKGILPTRDELEEIMGSMDKRFYIKICHALLDLIDGIEFQEEEIVENLSTIEEDDIVFESPTSQQRKVTPPQPEPIKKKVNPNTVLSPGQQIGSIIGNS